MEELLNTEARELLVTMSDDDRLEVVRLDELLLDDGKLEDKLLDDDLLDAGTELVVPVAHAPKSAQALAHAQPTPGS